MPNRDWTAPGHSQPAAISADKVMSDWIKLAYSDHDSQSHTGCAVIYNLSLQTLTPAEFDKVWIHNYAGDSVQRIHLVLPYHDGGPQVDYLAPWIDFGTLFTLVKHLSANTGDYLPAALRILRKTWVSLKCCPPYTEPPTDELNGAYAFSIFFSIPKPELSNNLDQPDPLGRVLESGETAERLLAESTRLIIGAGLTVPFSTYNKQGVRYEFVVPIGGWQHRPSELERCAITRHIELVQEIWNKHESPQIKKQSPQLEQLANLVTETKAVRLDAFLWWAATCLMAVDSEGETSKSDSHRVYKSVEGDRR